MKRRTMYTLFISATLLLAACTAGETESSFVESGEPTTTSVVPATEDTVADPAPPEESNVKPVSPLSVARTYEADDYPGELDGIVAIALNDLAERLDIETSDILVVSVEEVVWSNAGVGCPDPDMNYAQVVTDGLRIVLDAQGVDYAYHSGGSVDPFLCADKQTADPSDAIGTGEGPDSDDVPTTEGTIQLDKTVAPTETAPTEQPGGPGGQPDE